MPPPLIEFQNVSKYFTHARGRQLVRAYITRMFKSGHRERFYALTNVSFRLNRGESLGIVGRNGAGKSTLLSLIAGLAEADSGQVSLNGRVAALLELGAG